MDKKIPVRGYSGSMQPPLISKTRYLAGLQCPKLLWYHFNQPDAFPPVDTATQALLNQGSQVGAVAETLFPKGLEIGAGVIKKTAVDELSRAALPKRRPMFEAGFIAERAYARTDVLVRSSSSCTSRRVAGTANWSTAVSTRLTPRALAMTCKLAAAGGRGAAGLRILRPVWSESSKTRVRDPVGRGTISVEMPDFVRLALAGRSRWVRSEDRAPSSSSPLKDASLFLHEVELASQPVVDRGGDHHDEELQRHGQHRQPRCPVKPAFPSSLSRRFLGRISATNDWTPRGARDLQRARGF